MYEERFLLHLLLIVVTTVNVHWCDNAVTDDSNANRTSSCSHIQCPAGESCIMDVRTPTCYCNNGYYRNSSSERCAVIVRAFKSQLQLEVNYTQAYNDSRSPEFMSMAVTIEAEILHVLQKTRPEVVAIKVYALKKGSVIAEFNIILDAKLPTVNESQIQYALQTALIRGNFSELNANISVIPEVEDYNKCQADATNDCHDLANCFQNKSSYTCKCKAGSVGDGFNCRVLTTTVAPTAADTKGYITLTCYETEMTAVVNETRLPGRILNITFVGCDADKYTVYGNNTISTKFKDCAQNITQSDREITQENVVAIRVGEGNSTIDRVTWYYFKLQCIFDHYLNVTQAKVQRFEEAPIANFSAIMSFYKTKWFLEVADSPLKVATYEPIYVQITGEYNNTLFKFVTEQCYASTSRNASDGARYLFFDNKCALDNTFKEQNAGSKNKFSFSIDAFTFIQLQKEVFFHCTLLLCKANSHSDQCNQTCTYGGETTEEDNVRRITVHTGAVQHEIKPACQDTNCTTNAFCVDLIPPICRCNEGFVLNLNTSQCSNKNLISIFGLHLQTDFRSSYLDTSSHDFTQLAITVERKLMTSYALNKTMIYGVKVTAARKGSVVLDMQLMHAESVTSKEAFDSFINSVFETQGHNNVLRIKLDILPQFQENTTSQKESDTKDYITLTCYETEMTAVVNENRLRGKILNITFVGCNADKYTVYGNNTISTKFKDCAQNITQSDREITQENLVAIKAGERTSIIERIAWYYFKLQCMFDRHLSVTYAGVVNVGAKVQNFEVASIANFSAIMTFYKTESFFEVADSPLKVASYEPIYVQITGQYNNTMFKFVTEECYATPTGNEKDTRRYLFFGDKCGIDNTFKEYNAGSSNKFSFSIHAFRFIQLKKEVFFHCTLLVCKADTDSEQCSQPCTKLKRKRRETTADDNVGRITVHTGAIQHDIKPTCQSTSCPTNTYCVDLFPAICRCNEGFILNLNTSQCSNKNLLTISNVHLDIKFQRPYLDTSSQDFIQLATRVERQLMTSYALDKTIIYGVKVTAARAGSVVLDMQLMHAESITSKEAFDSFINSVFKSQRHNNVLRIKLDIFPQFHQNTNSQREITTVILVAVFIVLQLVVVLIPVFIIRNRRNKRKCKEPPITNFNTTVISTHNISS